MAKLIPIETVVDKLCQRNEDTLRRKKGLYLSLCEEVWNDLNEGVLRMAERVKIPIREVYHINKRTNSIDLPCNALRVCSVNVIDHHGNFHPIYRNEKLTDDLVDVGSSSICEHGCNHKLCNTIKGYEAVVTNVTVDVPIQGQGGTFDNTFDSTFNSPIQTQPQTFVCTSRKGILDGYFIEEKQYPLNVYTNGIWTDTVLHTETTKLCALQLDEKGCVTDTPENIENVCNSCGIKSDSYIPYGGTASCPPKGSHTDEWIYYCNNNMDWFNTQCGGYPRGHKDGFRNIYNISELGNRLIFPHDFGWDKVMVRFYSDISLQDLQIPYFAMECFMAGLQYFATTNNDNKQQLAKMYEANYSKRKKGLFLYLNQYRIAELAEIVSPHVYVPSYNQGNRGVFGDFYGI